jgi:hypothetical protein
MKKYLLKLLLRWYVNRYIIIKRLPAEEEMKMYLFDSPGNTVEAIRCLMTEQMLKHFDAKNDSERDIIRGGIMMLKILKDRNKQAVILKDKVKDKAKSAKMWTELLSK